MPEINPYEILGLPQGATNQEIKKAYKRLALKYHPDKNPGNPNAEAMFKKVAFAYHMLTNVHERAVNGDAAEQAEMAEVIDQETWECMEVCAAAAHGDIETLEKFLQQGFDFARRDWKGFENPLFYAHEVKVLRWLIEHKVDVNARDLIDNDSFLVYCRDIEIFELALQNGADVKARCYSSGGGNHRGSGSILSFFTCVVKGDSRYDDFLRKAELLLQHGADPEDTSKWYGSTLRTLGNQEMLQLLLSNGADPNNALILNACSVELLQVIMNEAVSGSVNVNAINDLGETALMHCNAETAELLLAQGADPDIQDNSGKTALMHLIEDPEVVTVLLSHNANTTLTDKEGKTAFMLGSEILALYNARSSDHVSMFLLGMEQEYDKAKLAIPKIRQSLNLIVEKQLADKSLSITPAVIREYLPIICCLLASNTITLDPQQLEEAICASRDIEHLRILCEYRDKNFIYSYVRGYVPRTPENNYHSKLGYLWWQIQELASFVVFKLSGLVQAVISFMHAKFKPATNATANRDKEFGAKKIEHEGAAADTVDNNNGVFFSDPTRRTAGSLESIAATPPSPHEETELRATDEDPAVKQVNGVDRRDTRAALV